ncbi:alpha/beta fold hydrolase [Hymenobacter sedentarius]|nr:alpha/beta hydrolase [Hymenobacter sedentarius]
MNPHYPDRTPAVSPTSPGYAQLPELPAPMPPGVEAHFFPGFTVHAVATAGATIHVLRGGSGPPLLLLHGHPETHVMWHKIAGKLARDYTVVLPDLRGYGDSSKPASSPDHGPYSFRSMAQDQVEVMAHFGFDTFFVAGHDRGGRVAHRLCLDHPGAVRKACVLDIAPTLTMYDDTSQEFATRYVWWFFQIQPFPVPENQIGFDPAYYLQHHLAVQNKTPDAIAPDALQEYLRCYGCRATIHAVCEDYRAAASIDLEYDRADAAAGHRVTAPLLVLWGARGTVARLWNVLATWQAKAITVSGEALDCGHFLPEEHPEAVLAHFQAFFRD